MKIADLQRLIKTKLGGKALKEVRVIDINSGEVFFIEDVKFHEEDEIVYIEVK